MEYQDTNSNCSATDVALQWTVLQCGSLVGPNSLPALQVQRFSPAALAYVGDAVYELFVRTYYLAPPKRLQDYHQQVVAQVRAESQAQHLRSLQPYLTEAERDILKRGRNAATRRPKRIALETYQQATSLETLMGYLYITDPQRLFQLLAHLKLDLETSAVQLPPPSS